MTAGTSAANVDGGEARERRLEAILDHASRQFNATGVSLGSLSEIAGTLGIARSALYGYVQDREDLVFQCYSRACEIMQQRFAAAASAHSDPFDILTGFIANVMDPNQPEAAALSELGCLRADQQRMIGERRGALLAALAGTISEGQKRGTMRARDPMVMAQVILSLVYWLKLAPRWLDQESNLHRQRLEEAARRLLFDGIALGAADIPTDFVDVARLAPQLADVFDRQAIATVKFDRMLATASRLFNHRGVDTTTVDEIAAELRVTKRTIYNHFPDKQALIFACMMRSYRIFTELAEQAAGWPGRRIEALGAAFYASILCSFQPNLVPLRVFSGLPGLSPENKARRDQSSAGLQKVYSDLLDQGVAEGSLRPVDLRATQLAMTGLSGWVGASADHHPQHVALEIAQLILFGLRSPPAAK